MASFRPASVTALEVGTTFVGQYYKILQQHPECAYKFYKDISTMSYIDGLAVNTANATTTCNAKSLLIYQLEQIHSLIMSLNFTGIEISTAHSMDSFSGGILLMISGSTRTQECGRRRTFVQTFFLAPQKNGYFILSDILQLMPKEIPPQPPVLPITPGSYFSYAMVSSHHVEPVTEHMSSRKFQGAHSNPTLHLNEHRTVDKYSVSEPECPIGGSVDRLKVSIEEPSIVHPSTVSKGEDHSSIVQAVEESVTEPIKHTYASILRIPKVRCEPSESRLKIMACAPNHTEVQPLVVPCPYNRVVSEDSTLQDLPDILTLEAEDLITSVYLRNLPSSVTAADLKVEFQNFGRIKPHGVHIKSRKEIGFYYGFVEFEDTQSVENAIKASPLLFNGHQIHVERSKRPRGAPSSGRRGRGNGRYQSVSRGRSGFREYGRINVQECGETGHFGRPYGNGFHCRGGHLGKLN